MKKFSSQFVKEDEGGGEGGGSQAAAPSNTTADMAGTGLQASQKNHKKFSDIFGNIFSEVIKRKAPK